MQWLSCFLMIRLAIVMAQRDRLGNNVDQLSLATCTLSVEVQRARQELTSARTEIRPLNGQYRMPQQSVDSSEQRLHNVSYEVDCAWALPLALTTQEICYQEHVNGISRRAERLRDSVDEPRGQRI